VIRTRLSYSEATIFELSLRFSRTLPFQRDGAICPFFQFSSTAPAADGALRMGTDWLYWPEQLSIPLDPKHVQASFLEAANHHDLADPTAILDRECMGDSELRQRVEALLRAHDRFNDFVDKPIDGRGGYATW
jgi:hypothetical protein